MKVFVLGVPNTQTTTQYSSCAFTMKAYHLCKMMVGLGHEVIHLGTEGSNPPCSEHVSVMPLGMYEEYYGHPGSNHYTVRIDGKYAQYHEVWSQNARKAIEERVKSPYEAIVCCTFSTTHADVVKDLEQFVVESGIGYNYTFAPFRVFESYAWMHFHLGREGRLSGDRWYDVVIPNAFDPEMFSPSETKEGYFLYMGRLNPDKGIKIAVDVTEAIGARLKICGQGDPSPFLADHVEYLPPVGVEGRRELMAKAKALFCPTQYVEPFGGVAVEAQLSGTPVICTDWGAYPETVVHGVTGYRCRTHEQFVWAANNVHRINPMDCRTWAKQNFSLDRIALMYEEYFTSLMDLLGKGWYAERNRADLRWLQKYYPVS